MAPETPLGGSFTMAEGLTVTRMGYGAMQLAGPGVFATAITVLVGIGALRGGRGPSPNALVT